MHMDSDLFSALQKFIRRGMDEDVLSVVNELCSRILSDYDVQKWHRLWRRLFIIATEDIGVAQQGTHRYLNSIHEAAEQHFYSNDDNDKAKTCCLEAVLTLCRSPKSRLTDNAYIYFSLQPLSSNVTLEALYQAIELKDEAALLQIIASVYRQRKCKHYKVRIEQVIQAIQANITNDLHDEFSSIVQAYQADECVLYLMHIGLLLCRPPSKSCSPQRTVAPELSYAPLPDTFPDFVYDKHTKMGREVHHRGLRHFVEQGCILNNCHITDPYYDLLLKYVRNCEK